MSDAVPLDPTLLASVAEKLDAFVKGDNPRFTRADAEELRKATAFVQAFHGDPATLKRVADTYTTVEGFVRVGKTLGYVLAFVVLVWTNFDRLADLFSGGTPK